MSLIAGCAACGKKYKLPDDKAGKKIKCQCGEIIAVPNAPGGDTPSSDSGEVAAAGAGESPPVLGHKTSAAEPKKKAKSSGGSAGLLAGMVVGALLLLGGIGGGVWMLFFRDNTVAPPVGAKNVAGTPSPSPSGSPAGRVPKGVESTGIRKSTFQGPQMPPRFTSLPKIKYKPLAASTADYRNFIPEDGQVAVVLQPIKVWNAKLVTTLVPEKLRLDFFLGLQLRSPMDPGSVEKIVLVYSPPPEGYPEKIQNQNPMAYMTAIIQFNDSLKMADRMVKLLGPGSPMKPMSGLPGPAWTYRQEKYDPGPAEGDGEKDGKKAMPRKSFSNTEEMQNYYKEEMKKREARSLPFPEKFDMCMYAPDDQTLVAGIKMHINVLARASVASPLKEVLKDANLNHELIIAGAKLDEFKMPDKVMQNLPGGPATAMPVMLVTGAATQLKQMLLQIGASPGLNLLDARLTAKNEAAAQQFEKQFEQGKQSGKKAATDAQPANSPGLQALEELEKSWKVERTGAELHLSVAHTQKLNDLVIAAFLPMMEAAKVAGDRTRDRNNLRQVALGMHNFASAYNKLPPGGGKGDLRESLPTAKQVGWLYDLLPFMEQMNVHNLVAKDKAWDDPVNQKAGATGIGAYLNSEIPVQLVGGYAPTHIVGIGGLGENGPNEPKGSKNAGAFAFNRLTSFRDFTDGTSNTIAGAQVYNNFGPWIANTTATIRPFTKKPYLHGPDGVGGPGKSGTTMVMMMDGSVRTLSDNTDPSIIEALATMGGGEAIDPTKLDAK